MFVHVSILYERYHLWQIFRSEKRLEFHKVYKNTHNHPFCRSCLTKWLIMSASSNMQHLTCFLKSIFFPSWRKLSSTQFNFGLWSCSYVDLGQNDATGESHILLIITEGNWIDKETNTNILSLKGVGFILYFFDSRSTSNKWFYFLARSELQTPFILVAKRTQWTCSPQDTKTEKVSNKLLFQDQEKTFSIFHLCRFFQCVLVFCVSRHTVFSTRMMNTIKVHR